MDYADYIGNVTRLAVELVNGDEYSEPAMLTDHQVQPADLAELLAVLAPAVAATADGGPIGAVNALLRRYPPKILVSEHDGQPHLHFADDGEDAASWLGRTCGAGLAHVLTGDPQVRLGRCHADGCTRFYVDQSRNRSRRFCSNACASRTTVAAYRARHR